MAEAVETRCSRFSAQVWHRALLCKDAYARAMAQSIIVHVIQVCYSGYVIQVCYSEHYYARAMAQTCSKPNNLTYMYIYIYIFFILGQSNFFSYITPTSRYTTKYKQPGKTYQVD